MNIVINVFSNIL